MLSIFIRASEILFTAVVSIVLADPIKYLLAKAFSGVFQRQNYLSGNWDTVYEYESKGNKTTDQISLELIQIGNYILGKSLHSDVDTNCKVRGKVDSGILSGNWYQVKGRRSYYGSFQLIVAPPHDQMRGQWIGFDSDHKIQNGKWNWKKRKKQTIMPDN